MFKQVHSSYKKSKQSFLYYVNHNFDRCILPILDIVIEKNRAINSTLFMPLHFLFHLVNQGDEMLHNRDEHQVVKS